MFHSSYNIKLQNQNQNQNIMKMQLIVLALAATLTQAATVTQQESWKQKESAGAKWYRQNAAKRAAKQAEDEAYAPEQLEWEVEQEALALIAEVEDLEGFTDDIDATIPTEEEVVEGGDW